VFHPSVDKSVFVTGCSSGIGRATIQLLRDAGWRVIASARKTADVERLRTEGYETVTLDLDDEDSVTTAAKTVFMMTKGTIGALVNNAGYGQAGALEDLSRTAMRAQFETNVFGLQQLTNLFIPGFRRQKAGRIVHVSSMVGRLPLPLMGLYSASKFAVEALGDVLRWELAGSGVAVSLIEPGPIITQFRAATANRAEDKVQNDQAVYGAGLKKELDARRRPEGRKPSVFDRPPEAVAELILHALESNRPRRRYAITAPAHFANIARRMFPDALIDLLVVPQLRKRAKRPA
jgi:short-subunit dehydrogenase